MSGPSLQKIGFLSSSDGTSLFFRASDLKAKKGAVVFVHGFGEHSGRYSHLAYQLSLASFASLSFDLRGHGRSDGHRAYVNSFEDYFLDVERAIDEARSLFNVKKVFIIAHSMGGLIASFLAPSLNKKLSGLILSSPAFGLTIPIPLWKSMFGRALSFLWPKFYLSSGVKGHELTTNMRFLKDYHRDPLVQRLITPRLYTEITRYQAISSLAAKNLDLPILMQLAGKDSLVSADESKKFFSLILSKDRSLKLYEDLLHEIYNEQKRDRPINDLINWMEKRCENNLPNKLLPD